MNEPQRNNKKNPPKRNTAKVDFLERFQALPEEAKVAFFQKLPDNDKMLLSSMTKIQLSESHFSGPLPHPDLLKQYDEAIPGLGKQIVQMARDEQEHRHSRENKETSTVVRGQIFAFIIVVLLIIAALICVFYGQWKVATGIFTVTIVSTAAVFYKAQKSSSTKR